jgi:hypothetical protein
LGFSDHLAQIVKLNNRKGNKTTKIAVRRHLAGNSMEELKNLLCKESWSEIFTHSEVNSS